MMKIVMMVMPMIIMETIIMIIQLMMTMMIKIVTKILSFPIITRLFETNILKEYKYRIKTKMQMQNLLKDVCISLT